MTKTLSALTALLLLASCASNLDPQLAERLDNLEERLEVQEEIYEDHNDELMDLLEEQESAFRKLQKRRLLYRDIQGKIESRNKRLAAAEDKALSPESLAKLNTSLASLKTQLSEVNGEMDELLAETREFTSQGLKKRQIRDQSYSAFEATRLELKELRSSTEK